MAIGSGGEEQRHRHACAACKHQGKKCDENCLLAQYFPAEKAEEFNAVYKTFGVKNLTKMLKSVPNDHRKQAADTLIWEAMAWKEDPLQGPRGLYNRVIAELNILQQYHSARSVGLCGEHDLGVQEIKYQLSTGETSRSKEYQQADTGHRGWVAPPPGWVKINVDSSAPFGDYIGGGICRNSLGKCLFGFTVHQCQGSDELGAQFQAIIKGLIEAWTRCHRKIIIEINSLEVVHSITNGVRPQDHFIHLSKIKELLGRDWCCRVERVGNEANLCANWLATMFAHESPGDSFFEVPPISIASILEKDLAGVRGL
ncbi:hypothetical protein SLEP1_g44884 [Rubroshorea leprosula]|uniref:LOB domain-containing protein n=1 Tax=Rubroshorea leprosula TaxID=152421 RepID=A0AAV5LIZ5_9ROSI|nr:hypothetical protein SLEP1_g44884 [Rubroshorea leprosula]